MENRETAQTIVSEDVEIVGTVKSGGTIHIDGKLNGDLSCSGDAIVGKKATIRGNVSVNSTTVMGQVHGNIIAKDRIELKSSARVNGDIKSKRLSVEDGVTFIGKSEVNPSGGAARKQDSAGVEAKADDVASAADLEEIKSKIKKGVKEELAEKTSSLFGKK